MSGLARPSTVQQHGCASARSLGCSSCSWKGITEHSALQGPQHRQKMWKGKKEVKLTCKKFTRELGIEKTGVWSYGPGIIQLARLPLQCGMFQPWCSAWALPWWSARPYPAAFQHTAWRLQSVGLQGKGRHFYWRNPTLCSRWFFLFFRKRLIRLTKEDGRHGRTFSGAALGELSRSGSDSCQAWSHCLHLLCLSFPISESTTQMFSDSLTLCQGLTFYGIQDPSAPLQSLCWPWAAEAGENLINLGVGVDLHS